MAATTQTEAKIENKAAKVEAKIENKAANVKNKIVDRYESVRGVTGVAASTTTAVGKAYVSGVYSLGKALVGFGREAAEDSLSHAKALTKASCLRNAAEMHAAFLQDRIENSTGHIKEFADLARVKSEETIKPIVDLLDEKKAA